jgi:hypothetical protein
MYRKREDNEPKGLMLLERVRIANQEVVSPAVVATERPYLSRRRAVAE